MGIKGGGGESKKERRAESNLLLSQSYSKVVSQARGGNLLHRHVGNNEPFRVVVVVVGTHELSKFHFKLNPIPSTIKSTIFDLRASTFVRRVKERDSKRLLGSCTHRQTDRRMDG